MPSINLLPWRQELRQRRRKEFLIGVAAAVVLAGIVTLLANFIVSSMIDAQNRRNELLKSEIAELDKAIEQILALEDQKARMISRMEVIDRLQAAGFVERRADPKDRRAWRLHDTDQARGVIDDMEDIARGLRRDATQGISTDDLQTMLAVLDRMKENLQGLDGPSDDA